MKYLVTSVSERTITIEAKNSNEAKKLACYFWGIKPSDRWCGTSSMKAKKIKEENNNG